MIYQDTAGEREIYDQRVQSDRNPGLSKVQSPIFVVKLVAMAAAIFGTWQMTYHWIFMVMRPFESMWVFHFIDWIAGAAGATLLTAYFVRILHRQNRRLRTLDWQKGLLVNAIVNDFHQPLSVVLMSLRDLRKEIGPTALAQKLLATAQSSAQKLMEMASDLLDLARLEGDQALVEFREISPAEFIVEGVRRLQPLTVMNDQILKTVLPPALPNVKGDKERLRRVVTNLMSNAIESAGMGGTITVTASHDPESERLLISIGDTGLGAPPELRARLFKKIARSSSRPGGGLQSSGMGFYVCKLIIEAHGGDVWLDNNEAQGATFTFSLPAIPSGAARNPGGQFA
jgi:signal transduction histidine kinase